MSMRCRISKLDRGLKSKIVALLYANGCAKEDVDMLINEEPLPILTELLICRRCLNEY